MPKFAHCVLLSLPISVAMSYTQFRLLGVSTGYWLICSIIFPAALVPVSTMMIARDLRLSLYLLVQATFVHMQRAYIDEQSIAVVGPLGREQIRWFDVRSAVLKERENVMTRTDQLFVLRGPTSLVLFNTSTLSASDEVQVLDLVRRLLPTRTNTIVPFLMLLT